MVRVTYEGRGGKDVVRWFRQKMERIEAGNADAIENSVEYGATVMKGLIETRGTGRQWTRPDSFGRWSSSPGRVASGTMRDSVASSFNKTAKGNAVGRFGWLKNREDYFRYQEGGFEHPSGITVEGMYAMTDAYEEMRQKLEAEIGRNLRGA